MIGPSDSPVSVPFEGSSRFAAGDFVPPVQTSEEEMFVNTPLMDELSNPLVGQWNTLVSRTNWEKGEIILHWRQTMVEAELPKAAYSDDVWAKRVGNVTPQHTGRLRRVAERFGSKVSKFPKLYWSHFQVALDWDDAELWLEGAVQNDWSVAQMKVQRWETLGASEEFKPRDEDVFTAEWDDDAVQNSSVVANTAARHSDRTELKTVPINGAEAVEGFDSNLPPFDTGKEIISKKEKKSKTKTVETPNVSAAAVSTKTLMESLNDFSGLPNDFAEALESVKVAVLNHKLSGWKDVSVSKIAGILGSLKLLLTSTDESLDV